MGGETEAQVSPWTVDSLKEHFEQRIDDLEARLQERKEAQETALGQVRRETERALADAATAVLKSEDAATKRFESVNEFRGQLADQVKTFMTRETYEVGHAALESKVGVVENLITGIVAEKRGSRDLTAAIYAFAGFLAAIVVLGGVVLANR